jgi:hypothetical protein
MPQQAVPLAERCHLSRRTDRSRRLSGEGPGPDGQLAVGSPGRSKGQRGPCPVRANHLQADGGGGAAVPKDAAEREPLPGHCVHLAFHERVSHLGGGTLNTPGMADKDTAVVNGPGPGDAERVAPRDSRYNQPVKRLNGRPSPVPCDKSELSRSVGLVKENGRRC